MADPRLCLCSVNVHLAYNAFNYSLCPSPYLFHSPHLTSRHSLTPRPIDVTTGGVFVKTLAIDRCLDCPHFFRETPRRTAHRGDRFVESVRHVPRLRLLLGGDALARFVTNSSHEAPRVCRTALRLSKAGFRTPKMNYGRVIVRRKLATVEPPCETIQCAPEYHSRAIVDDEV